MTAPLLTEREARARMARMHHATPRGLCLNCGLLAYGREVCCAELVARLPERSASAPAFAFAALLAVVVVLAWVVSA